MDFGSIRIGPLLDCVKAELIMTYLLKELETTWRQRFPESQKKRERGQGSPAVDQLVVILDLRALKLKDLSNKQVNVMFKSMVAQCQASYPCLLAACYILHAPMFFEDFYLSHLKPLLGPSTAGKVRYTGEASHAELLARVDPAKLPREFGGLCECEAGCVYSGRGPWTEPGGENRVNFRKRGELITQQQEAAATIKTKEEFKFLNEDDEEEDLLHVKRQQLADLKSSLNQQSE